MELGFSTRCLYGNNEKFDKELTGTISFPIYQTATYAHPEVGKSTGFDYTRSENPTRNELEKVVASLEKGKAALAFSSGMAAISALFELFSPGDHVITDSDLYGGSLRLFDSVSKKNGIEFSHVNCSEENVEDYIKDNTKAIYIETPTNPMMNIVDIRKMAEIAKRHEIFLIVDNTFLSPYFQNPLELGADVVVHSGTKFLSGHNDTLAGFLVTSSKEIEEKLRYISKTIGNALSPFDSWLVLRGIKTLPLRMEKAQENAQKIVDFLQSSPHVKIVYYPGIEGREGYEISKSQAKGFGSMISFEVETKEEALKILKNTKLIPFAESLGGVETLITYPSTQTHADVPEEIRNEIGLTDRLLRLSVGIENAEDLIEDLKQAFEK